MNKLQKAIRDPRIRFGYLSRLGLLNWMSDEKYLKKEYFLNFGKQLDLKDPKTFNEKIQWLKIYDRKDIYTTMVDKALAKKYVARTIGAEYIIPTLGVYDRFEEIDFDKLPKRFVIKCTHDSGGIMICKDKAKFDKVAARKKINAFLKRKYYYIHREWPYKNVIPRILVEKYMEDGEMNGLIDYKVMCFNGKAKLIFTCTERFGSGLKVTFFDLNWTKLPFERHYPASDKKITRPKNLSKMINLSEKLSKNTSFIRIDWYEINGRLYFGEYTFYPGAGLEEFTPCEWDEKIGNFLDINRIKAMKGKR